ncbi:poly(A) polymerase [Aliiroseovarius halocynthiae]|uniref:CCA tRNA nucleotidyltransferase n=1 Tax=Aliiroseovarius halocynthiae TaxID=985055 RepID=A0A545SNL1_9RHOB|nr:CCA tRNA nucleotidyltransferase [Aliiroseovarius halocynthiae]TQV66573.1 CCA tRNA nucleotidyltransferase [Aliiroseovarius halocynthiae]SMR82559.1 poly(A) polymerase [Aliiroseovarius halocynthiae]
MTSVRGEWINDPGAQQVCALLTDAGYQVYFVGGCVRNDLLGVAISDLDMCSDALPARVMELAEDAGLRVLPTGIDHGTVTIVIDHEPYEITTFRKDVQTDGRRAVVAFSDRIEDDARRRDFTMNALYAASSGRVLDPLGGLPDLDARRVRFIDDAGERIREDYLRTLRFFRFHAWYGNVAAGIDPDGLAACASNLAGLETLSKERIGTEMLKILSAPDPAPAMAAMAQSGVLAQILPGADASKLALLVHLEGVFPADPLRRLALLGGQDVPTALRLSKKQAKRLEDLRDGMGSAVNPGELAYRLGADDARNIALLRAALFETPLPADVDDAIATGAAATFPIKPADLLPDLTGPALGARLRELEARWIASDFTLTREELLT